MEIQGLMILVETTMLKLRKLFSDEKGDVNIVSIVVLIGIAILLALAFKDQIATLLGNLFKTIGTNTKNALETPINVDG